MKALTASTLLATAFLASCSIPQYQDPALPPESMAVITFQNQASTDTGFQVFLGENCTQRRLVISPVNSLTSLAAKEERTLRFAAGQPFSFEFHWGVASTDEKGQPKYERCQLMSTFTPEAGIYRIDGVLGDSGCALRLAKQNGSEWLRLDANKLMHQREPKVAFGNDGPWCR